MSIHDRLSELGLTLPQSPKPLAAYVPAVLTGNLVFVSGQVPLADGELKYNGRLGDGLSLEDGQAAARIAVLNCLGVVEAEVGLDRVARVVKLTGYVASAPDFFQQPQVINGASQLIEDVLGSAGQHARAAVGVSALPLGASVEIEIIVQVKPE